MNPPDGGHGEAVLLFAHGAREPRWASPFERVRDRLRRLLPGTTVELAFLEFMAPDLPDAVAALAAGGARRVRVMPMFLGAGGHVLRDLPALLDAARARHPRLRIDLLAPLGEQAAIIDTIADGCAALLRPEAQSVKNS